MRIIRFHPPRDVLWVESPHTGQYTPLRAIQARASQRERTERQGTSARAAADFPIDGSQASADRAPMHRNATRTPGPAQPGSSRPTGAIGGGITDMKISRSMATLCSIALLTARAAAQSPTAEAFALLNASMDRRSERILVYDDADSGLHHFCPSIWLPERRWVLRDGRRVSPPPATPSVRRGG